jgi:Tfp pilus assembly protein PilV
VVPGAAGDRAGFTLIEALISLVLSAFVVMLVSSTFLIQNNYYATQLQRTRVQDNARVATEMIAAEIRSASAGGFVVAGARTLTVRAPMVVTVLCSRSGTGAADVHTEGGQAGLDVAEVAGVAVRDSATGAWSYANATWATLNGSDAGSASSCAGNGADVTGAATEFHGLANLNTLFSPVPSEGDVVMLFRETTFKIQASVLDPTGLGLFRGSYGDPLIEFATGMDTTARFQYRTTGTSSYADTLTGAAVANVDAVRIVADARRPAQTGGRSDITFGWAVNVAVRNVP